MAEAASGGRGPTGRCRHCGRATFNGSSSCKARRCPGYAPLWAGDQRRKLFDNLAAFAGQAKVKDAHAVMLSVTAPGADELPWDRDRCRRLGEHECTGDLGCRVKGAFAKAWNRTAPKRWSKLHRRASAATKRIFGNDALWMLGRVWEMQSRGVLHVHPVFAYATPRQRAAVRHYRAYLDQHGSEYGAGFVGRKFRPQPAKGAAAYLSAYFCAGKKDKLTLRESVMSHDMPRSIVHVSTKLTMETGVTMRELRFRRFVWVRCSWLMHHDDTIVLARRLAELERETGREFALDEAMAYPSLPMLSETLMTQDLLRFEGENGALDVAGEAGWKCRGSRDPGSRRRAGFRDPRARLVGAGGA